jgi:hypothetical protein
MSERLDRIEALLLNTVERLNEVTANLGRTTATLDRVAIQQERNTDDIDTLLGAISTAEVEVRKISASVAANEQRFNILISEMRSDRQVFRNLIDTLTGRIDGLERAS